MNPSIRYRAALIDMDGVLYDSMKYHTLAWHRMMTEIGVPCTREEFYRYEGMTGRATIELLFRRHFNREATEDEIRELYDRKTRYFEEIGRRETMPHAAEVLRYFRQRGLRCVLVTGSGQGSILERVERDYPDIFDARVTARDVRHGKPHPEPYLMGAAKAGVPPEECVALENAPLGCQSAHAAGCFTIGVTTGPLQAPELAEAGADRVFTSMLELANNIKSLL